jgi:GNAT superfamily N-acetyltransferase
MPMQHSITHLKSSERELLRQIRLAALEDAPYAFTTTLANERATPLERWRAILERNAWFAALSGGVGIGLAAGTRGPVIEEDPEVRQLVSMWVAPEFRGDGLAEELVQAVKKWAKEDGANVLSLPGDGEE